MINLTEKMIDAPRIFLLGLELEAKNLKDMRRHMKNCGASIECWPDWAKIEDGHITKAGKAIIIFTMMMSASEEQAAEETPPDPAEGFNLFWERLRKK